MTKSMLFFIAVLMVMLGAGPALAQDREYVGETAGTTGPDVGIIALHTLCDAAFSGARMCMSGDIVRNGARAGAALPGDRAWVSPILVAISVDPIFAFDIGGSGTDDSGSLTCEAWSTNTPAARRGLTLTADGNLFPARCSTDRPVACCAVRKGKK